MMAAVVVFKILLSAVFLVAGLSKLADIAGSSKALRDFGVPEGLAVPLAILLPVGELAIGAGLIQTRFGWFAAGGALALLTTFIVAIAVTLARGGKPNCHCFGQLHSKPIGWDLVARNVALSLIAGLVLYKGPNQAGVVEWLGRAIAGHELLFAFGVAGLVLATGHLFLTFQLVKQGGRLLLRLDEIEKRLPSQAAVQPTMVPLSQEQGQLPPLGLRVGENAPSFSLKDLSGRTTSLEELLAAAKPVILLFVHPDCGPCAALLPKARGWQEQMGAHCGLVLISQGSQKQNLAKIKGPAFPHFLLQEKQEVSEAYQCAVTPSGVVVRSDRTIGSPVASGSEQIQSLIVDLVNEVVSGKVLMLLKEGDPVPRLVYPDLDGNFASLTFMRGRMNLILFWNPSCGFCREMVPEVNGWHALLPGIVVISTGSVEENQKMGLKPRVLLDRNFSAGETFGARSTPSAVLIDGEGRVSSRLATGRAEIMALISRDTISVLGYSGQTTH